jgi:hypothetical protein
LTLDKLPQIDDLLLQTIKDDEQNLN